MASDQTFSTGDLRSHSVDYKRDNESKQKWSNGEAWGPGRQSTAHARPAKKAPKQKRSTKELGVASAKLSQRREILDTDNYTTSESSADEEVAEPSAAPMADADVTYSYDAKRGPHHGSQILSIAISKAVECYENNVTDNLVQNEYEMLDEAGEVVTKPAKKASKRDASLGDEGFVLV